MIKSDYSAPKIRWVIQLYKDHEPQAGMLYKIIQALEDEGVNSDKIMETFYHHTAMMISNNVSTGDIIYMINGLLRRRISKNKFKRVGKRVLELNGANVSKQGLSSIENGLGKAEVCRLKEKYQDKIDKLKEEIKGF